MSEERTLTLAEARAFYDAFGARQDGQAFYEDPANRVLVAHAELPAARAVLELGCGTGRLAEQLLAGPLPPTCTYLATDVSATMVGLARARLARFGARAEVRPIDGAPKLDVPDGRFDRFVSTYVFDLLPRPHIAALLDEARRSLVPGGLVALTGLTHGRTPLGRLVSGAWRGVHRLRPLLVGGCRPLDARPFFAAPHWRVEHASVVQSYGLTSQILVARRLDYSQSCSP